MSPILIGVVTCERDASWLAAARETWLAEAPALIDVVIVDAKFLFGIPDSYEALPRKTRSLCQYAFIRGYQHVLKTDVDTYIRPKLLEIPEAEYAGRLRGKSAPEYAPDGVANVCDYCSGGAYWLSHRAIEIIAKADLTKDVAEDRWVGNTLHGFGIHAAGVRGFIAPTHVPVSDYLKSANTVALMQMESPRQMRDAHFGKFDPPVQAAGSQPDHFPVGSMMRNQMR